MSKKPAARYWGVDEIPPLPKSLYKSVYGDNYNDDWILRPAALSNNEKEVLKTFFKSKRFESVYLISEIDRPQIYHQNDPLKNRRAKHINKLWVTASLFIMPLKAN